MIGLRLSSPLTLCSHDRGAVATARHQAAVLPGERQPRHQQTVPEPDDKSRRHLLDQATCRNAADGKARLRRRPGLHAKRADATMETIFSVTLCVIFAQAAPESTFFGGSRL